MRYTDAPRRRQELLRRLGGAGYVSSQRLAADLGVSEMTIRRDLQRLEQEGLVHRVAGGAALPEAAHGGRTTAGHADGSALQGSPWSARRTDPREGRLGRVGSEKRAIASAAVRLIESASSVALDAGTTVVEVAHLLPSGMLVVTPSVPVLTVCAERGDLDVIGLGGSYQHASRSFAGPETRTAIRHLAVDVSLLSAVAVGEGGLYCTSPLDGEVKRLLIEVGRTAVLLVDHTKITASAPLRFAGWDRIAAVVTDAGADAADLAWLRTVVSRVVVAPLRDQLVAG